MRFPDRITWILARFKPLLNIGEKAPVDIIASSRYITGQKCSSVGIKKSTSQCQDQTWFAEKGKPHEATVLKRLSEIEMSDEGEFRKVRRDRIFEKDYFDKKYGALPEVSDGFDLIEAMKG